MKKRQEFLRGSYTVEAAAVVTMTMFLLAAILIVTFYLHDRAVIQSMVCEAASAGSNFATAAEQKAAARTAIDRIGESRLAGGRGLSRNAAVSARKVTAHADAQYPAAGMAGIFLPASHWEIKAAWSCRLQDPADAIRKIKGVGELLTGGDD